MKRHGVTASFHTNEPAGTQISISALLTFRSEIKNAIQNNMYTGLTIVNVNTLNYQRVVKKKLTRSIASRSDVTE